MPWNRAVFLPLVAVCLLLMTAVWAGGEWLFSVNMADHHTFSHMPASMIYGCYLSWTKLKVHPSESDKGLVSLPDWCVHFHSLAERVFLFHFREFLFPCDLLREIELCHLALGATCTYACTHKYISHPSTAISTTCKPASTCSFASILWSSPSHTNPTCLIGFYQRQQSCSSASTTCFRGTEILNWL